MTWKTALISALAAERIHASLEVFTLKKDMDGGAFAVRHGAGQHPAGRPKEIITVILQASIFLRGELHMQLL